MDGPEELIDRIRLPRANVAPTEAVLRRIGSAIGLIFFVAIVVRLGRGGYVDITDDSIGMLDALYYASVTVTTTGYGDITAVSDGARLATILLITPARILFLILVVGTTVEVLTDQSRQNILVRRWRERVENHIVICGFGATGHSAASELVSRGTDRSEIVIVDADAAVVQRATYEGFVAVHGDATHRAVLEQASVQGCRAIVVTPNRDDTAVLVTLTARDLAPDAHIVAGARERENLHLLSQGGADEVIDETAAVGRMIGLATEAPGAVGVFEDILDSATGLELVEVAPAMIDDRPSVPVGSTLIAAIRNGHRVPPSSLDVATLQATDRLIVLREANGDHGVHGDRS